MQLLKNLDALGACIPELQTSPCKSKLSRVIVQSLKPSMEKPAEEPWRLNPILVVRHVRAPWHLQGEFGKQRLGSAS